MHPTVWLSQVCDESALSNAWHFSIFYDKFFINKNKYLESQDRFISVENLNECSLSTIDMGQFGHLPKYTSQQINAISSPSVWISYPNHVILLM